MIALYPRFANDHPTYIPTRADAISPVSLAVEALEAGSDGVCDRDRGGSRSDAGSGADTIMGPGAPNPATGSSDCLIHAVDGNINDRIAAEYGW